MNTETISQRGEHEDTNPVARLLRGAGSALTAVALLAGLVGCGSSDTKPARTATATASKSTATATATATSASQSTTSKGVAKVDPALLAESAGFFKSMNMKDATGLLLHYCDPKGDDGVNNFIAAFAQFNKAAQVGVPVLGDNNSATVKGRFYANTIPVSPMSVSFAEGANGQWCVTQLHIPQY